MGCISTSDEKAKIKYKEYQIENRKKKFGVDYMNLKLKEGGSTDDELKACIDTCLEDLEKLNKEIADLEAEIDRVNTATEAKIIKKPGAEGAATGTAAASATAAAPETPAPAAEATATAST
jgi:predicted RNase H-like nuclease (RuvC/YqgF family)